MSKIKIERAIYGSLDNVVGDGILSFSSGISRRANIFMRLFDSIANKLLSKKYASLLLFLNPDKETYSCAHIQGSHVEFPAEGRSYCTRCVYEFEAQHLETYGFFPIIQSLPRMEHRQSTDSDVCPDVEICQPKQSFGSLDENEKKLFHIINHAILNGKQVFIHINSHPDDYSENHVFESSKLKNILNAFDCMPERLKNYLSLAFSTDAYVNKIVNQVVKPLVIVHHDDISNWNTEEGITINWETYAIDCPIEYEESSKCVRDICEIPLVSDYLSGADSNPSHYDTFRWIGGMRSHLDLAIDSEKPNNNDVTLMDLSYASCESKTAYRHYDMASKLYHIITQDSPSADKLKVTTDRLINDYPELANSSTQQNKTNNESPVTAEADSEKGDEKDKFQIAPINKEMTESNDSSISVFKLLATYHIDYIIIALCTALLTYLALTIPKEKVNLSQVTNDVECDLPKVNDTIDTLFIDVDIPTGKIERATLAKISNRVLERILSSKDTVSKAILCLHTDEKEIILDLNNSERLELDSIYSLFGKSLTTGSYSLRDTISASLNGLDSIFVVDKKHRFYNQIKGCKGIVRSMIVANDSKKDTISFDNILFKQTYHVEADLTHVLYFFYIVNKVESWRETNKIKDNLNY